MRARLFTSAVQIVERAQTVFRQLLFRHLKVKKTLSRLSTTEFVVYDNNTLKDSVVGFYLNYSYLLDESTKMDLVDMLITAARTK